VAIVADVEGGTPVTDLDRFEPPDVPLRLTRTGPGSRAAMVDYVQRVLTERTTPNADTTADRLARALTTAILSRLGAGYSIATGQAWITLVEADPSQPEEQP
jgi:hypothetical protein